MPARQLRRRLAAMATVAALTFAGCASGSPQTGATTFLDEHAAAAARVAAAAKTVQGEVSRLSSPPSRPQLGLLARSAGEAQRNLVQASEWNVAGQGEEGAEEEDVPRAETQVTEGAAELADATSALQAYARAPSAAALARYESKLASGRTQWNEGIAQLWYLAHASHPPTV
ncbi:MAG: hypothetical protein ABSB69_11000 [Solirubrobacteraceae bacterium]